MDKGTVVELTAGLVKKLQSDVYGQGVMKSLIRSLPDRHSAWPRKIDGIERAAVQHHSHVYVTSIGTVEMCLGGAC